MYDPIPVTVPLPIDPVWCSKRDGQGYRLMIGPLCDVDSQQLLPGGVAILFAWGHPSTNILKQGQPLSVTMHSFSK